MNNSRDNPEGEENLHHSHYDPVSMAAMLDEIAEDCANPWDLLQRLTESTVGEDLSSDRSPVLEMLERALAHTLKEDSNRRTDVVMGVQFSSANGDWPPALDTIDLAEKDTWSEVAQKATASLPRAHLLDLSMSTGRLRGRDVAGEVASLYLELGKTRTLDTFYRIQCLRRCVSIARKFNLPSENGARSLLYNAAVEFSEMEKLPVGPFLSSLTSLCESPRTGDFANPARQQVKDLLVGAFSVSEISATLIEGAADLLLMLADSPEEREAAHRLLTDSYMALAEGATGVAIPHWLDTAAKHAQRHGLIDLRDKAVAALQSVSRADLEMERHSFGITMPRHLADSRLGQYRRSYDAYSAIDMWLTGPSPTGRHENNLQQASKLAGSSLLQLFTRTTLSASGLPVRTSKGLESATQEFLERTEDLNTGVYGTLISHELEAINAEYGPISKDRLAIHLASRYLCDAELARALSQSMEHFWEMRYSDAGRVAFPLVEAGARGLLLSLGDPLYRVQTGDAGGRFPALEKYAAKLEEHGFDDDWLRCLRNPVSRLRNSMAHGHLFELSAIDAAVLIRMAALLVTLTPANASLEDRTQIEARLRDPLAYTGGQSRLVKRWRRTWVVGRTRPGWKSRAATLRRSLTSLASVVDLRPRKPS